LELGETNRMYIHNPAIDYATSDCPACESECFTFDDDLQDFTPRSTSPSGDDPAYNELNSLTWVDGEMVIDAGIAPNSFFYGGALSPTIDHIIEEGDVLCISVTAISTGSYNSYVSLKLDGSWVDLTSITGVEVPRDNSVSLDPYIGQHLEGFFFMWGRSTDFQVSVTSTGINCPECAS